MAKKKQPGSITITNGLNTNWTNGTITGTNWSSGWSTGTFHSIPTSIQIGNGTLEEIEGELWWVRADGSKSCLTGKSNNFKQIYDILNDGD
jgi:hypothetical protein